MESILKRSSMLLACIGSFYLGACNGSSSSSVDTGKTIVIEGEVEEGSLEANLNGGATKNTGLEGVEVCALNVCAVTNANGVYEFVAQNPGIDSAIEFYIKGKDFSSEIPIRIAGSTKELEVIFLRDPALAVTRAVEVELDHVVDPGQSDGNFNDGD